MSFFVIFDSFSEHMRFRILLIFLLFTPKIDIAQALTEINCFKGTKKDILKSIEPLSGTDYLLNIRSNSNTNYFTRTLPPTDSAFLMSSWLFRVNSSGDTIWKKEIQNTHKTRFIAYNFSFAGYEAVAANDYVYSIYTKIGNDLFLHYNYFNTLGNSISSTDLTTKNNLLMAGIIDAGNGTYKIVPFCIDTLQRTALDTSLRITSAIAHKITDSTYQIAIQFNKLKQLAAFDLTTWFYTNFYLVNINSKSVQKKSYEGFDIRLINADNRFFLLQTVDDDLLLQKIALNGITELSVSLKTNSFTPNINFVKAIENGKLLLGGEENNSTDSTTRTDAVLFVANTNNLSLARSALNNHPTASVSTNYYYPQSSNFLPVNAYEESTNTFSDAMPYVFLSESYLQNPDMINVNKVIRFNKQTGAVLWSKVADGYSSMAADAQQNGVILFKDSVYTTANFVSLYKSTLQKIDSNGIISWIQSLPEQVVIGEHVYYAGSTILNYFPVNYKNQFIVTANYLDTLTQLTLPIHFLVNNNTGVMKRMIFYVSESVPAGLFQPTYFFVSPVNNLSVLIQEEDKCLAASDTDIVIYRYNDLTVRVEETVYRTSDISVYPNPATAQLNVDLKEWKGKEITFLVSDISGKILLTGKQQNVAAFQLNIAEFPTGLYLLSLTNNKTSVTKKFQVIH